MSAPTDLTTTLRNGKPGYDTTGRVAGFGDSATGGVYLSDVAKQSQTADSSANAEGSELDVKKQDYGQEAANNGKRKP